MTKFNLKRTQNHDFAKVDAIVSIVENYRKVHFLTPAKLNYSQSAHVDRNEK